MACWIHPISGKGGGQECSVLLPDRAAGWSPRRPAPRWGWGAVRGGDDSQRAFWAARGRDHGSPFGHCDTAGSFPHWGHGLQAPNMIPAGVRQKGNMWMGFFSYFQIFFKKVKNCTNFTRMTIVVLFLAG